MQARKQQEKKLKGLLESSQSFMSRKSFSNATS